MKLLLDTHAFIWWDSDPGRLSATALAALRDPANEPWVERALHGATHPSTTQAATGPSTTQASTSPATLPVRRPRMIRKCTASFGICSLRTVTEKRPKPFAISIQS